MAWSALFCMVSGLRDSHLRVPVPGAGAGASLYGAAATSARNAWAVSTTKAGPAPERHGLEIIGRTSATFEGKR
jgi:hypothetical protein